MLNYSITAADHCRLLESFLQNRLPGAPLSYVRKLLKSGHCAVNGRAAVPGTILRLGDMIALKESGRTSEFLTDTPPELDILFEDDRILVFNKAPGIPVHKAAEDGGRNLVALAEAFLRRRDLEIKLRPVNRIDRGTSGAVVLAKSATGAGMFGRMVKEEGFAKLYLAVVEGVTPAKGIIAEPLDGKESETRFQVIYQGADRSLLAVWPISGRMHQIRKHLSMVGHPVAGDRRYGGEPLPGYAGHLLHAFRTGFRHPESDRLVSVTAPLPAGFLEYLHRMTGPAFDKILLSLPEIPAETMKVDAD